ncbi:glycosyltransferase family A protein [Pedobacter sp. KBW06]|uniref:glycosyltransferase family A protein n=1 Tax=Pedobacter sp. KBW06 TaxID=2153359 RepID=UPI000F5B1D07|nr:glycosyltransferase family A protein [Pedobacter sp. KBW06]
MGNYGRKFTDLVSLIIKVEKEKSEADELLASIAAQDYKHLQIIIQYGATPFSVKEATGDYFLFLTADTLLKNGFIHSLIYRTKIFNLALLSVIPTQRNRGFLANCVYPLTDFVLLNLFPLRLVRLINHPVFATANESCLFFDASLYRRFKWDERVKRRASRAVEIVKMVKQEGLKADVLLGNRLIYFGARQLEPGSLAFSRGLMLNFSNNVLVAVFYLIFVIAGPIIMSIELEPAFLVLPFGLIFLSRVMTSFLSAQHPVPNILLHPLQMLALVWLLLSNIWNRLFSGLSDKK